MKDILKILLVLSLVSSTSFTAFGQSLKIKRLIDNLENPYARTVMVAAHRGDWRNAPENSLKAFDNAINMGVDIIEVDLNISKDGHVIIMHDDTIERTTEGKGKPSDYTLNELKKFHLKNGLGRLSSHTIPTLEEVMLLAKDRVLVNLDKSYPYYKEAYKILKQTNTLHQAIFKTDAKYEDVRKKYPILLDSIVFMPVVSLDKPEAINIINTYQKELNPVAFELIFSKDTSALLFNNEFIKKNGSKIWINSLWPSLNGGHFDDLAVEENNKKDSWDWLILHGATILQTDRPIEMIKYLKKEKLR